MRFACLGLAVTFLAATSCKGPEQKPPPELKELKITDTKVGTGPKAEKGDVLMVEYVGKLANGKQFGAEVGPIKPPHSFALGAGTVIEGWDKGLVGVQAGGERDLAIPATMGYGAEARTGIPANSPLFFHIKVLGILKPSDSDKILASHDDKVGTGPSVQRGNVVTIRYKATYLNGNVYDELPTLTFHVGDGFVLPQKNARVVAGLNRGVVGMKKGGKRTLVLPPNLSQRNPMGPEAPTYQILKFEVELLDVK